MTTPQKIIIFTGYFIPHLGGVERYVEKLSSALFDLGFNIVIVTSNDSNLPNFEKKEKYSIYRLPIRNIFKNRYPIPKKNSEYKKLVKKVKEENGDYFIVNTRFHLTSLIGAKIGKKQNKLVFLIEHGTDHFTVNNKTLDFFGHIYEHILTIYIKKFVDKYYGVSKKCNDWLTHYKIKASGVFYNCTDINYNELPNKNYCRFNENKNIIISYAGRLIKEKGILNLIEAFQKLEKENKNIKLIIAGDGNLFNNLKKEIKDEKIELLGKIPFEEVMSLYSVSDIFVYPSLYPEGLPTSILEAGLMKCAVIATPRGGTEEVIPSDEYGLVISGTVESIYESLKKLIYNKELRKKMGEKLNERIKKEFSWEIVAKKVKKELVENERLSL